jgi:hypothetical protein
MARYSSQNVHDWTDVRHAAHTRDAGIQPFIESVCAALDDEIRLAE